MTQPWLQQGRVYKKTLPETQRAQKLIPLLELYPKLQVVQLGFYFIFACRVITINREYD